MNEGLDFSEDDVRDEMLALREACRSVVIATVSAEGEPDASYAPYVSGTGGDFWIFVSRLARHTVNLEETGRASLLFLESEAGARQIFGRQRLTYACQAQLVSRAAREWDQMLDALASRFGPVVGVLRQLSDFELIRLHPDEGSYVRGFGQAFRLCGEGLADIVPLRPDE